MKQAIFDIETGPVEPKTFFVTDVRRGAHTKQHIMVVVIVLFEVMRIICRDERNPHLLIHLEEFLVHDLLFADPVTHDLQVVAVSEELLEILRNPPSLVLGASVLIRND